MKAQLSYSVKTLDLTDELRKTYGFRQDQKNWVFLVRETTVGDMVVQEEPVACFNSSFQSELFQKYLDEGVVL